MDALRSASKWSAIELFLYCCMVVAAPTGICRAGDCGPSYGSGQEHAFDGTTLCRWRRTWHGPNAVWTPLNAYYIPRPADPCEYGGYGNGCGAAVDGGNVLENEIGYDSEQAVPYGFTETPGLPAGLERLGQIPNDLGIAGGAPAAPVRPGR